MSVIYSDSSNKYIRDLSKVAKTLEDKKLKKRLYNNDTSKFEPIPENRTHLINCLIPMVIRICNNRIKTFGLPNELSDVLSSGIQGAIIATDIYIEKSKTEVQPAKLSTFAFSYIVKYINEYLYKNQSILSFGPTKDREIREYKVYEGNNRYSGSESDKESTSEFFESSGELNLMIIDEYNNQNDLSENISIRMFKNLSYLDKKIVFMFFGIGLKKNYEIKEISKITKLDQELISTIISESITKMKSSFTKNESSEVLDILLSSDLTQVASWQKVS